MTIREKVEYVTGEKFSGLRLQTGKIVSDSGQAFFLKTGPVAALRCEANGLYELSKAAAIRIPRVIAVDEEFLLTEYMDGRPRGERFFREFGRKLARLHRYTTDKFGFYEDNFIGSTPQLNLPDLREATDWSEFYLNKRLNYQFRLAEQKGYISSRLEDEFSLFTERIRPLLEESAEPPALLHGDLWNGNFLADKPGEVVLIDPAVYYGHREAELAMTLLFGGFSPEFYQAYQQEYPLKPGWQQRVNLYKLYHVLNHLNMFGTGYLREAEELIRYYL